MGSSFRLARIMGVDVGVHWSWVLIFGIVTWSFATGVLDHYYPGWTDAQRWSVAALVSLVFFLSVLVHELSHAVVSNRLGLPVRSITLFVFGGIANLDREPEHASEEFKIAIVGPLSSLALGVVFAAGWAALYPINEDIAGISAYLALINVSLAVFNMLPGFPLDGGRVFRSIVWDRNRDRLRATRVASRVGEFIAYGMMAIGVLEMVVGGVVSGIWFVLIGLFLRNASVASYEQLLIETTLSGIRVRDVMRIDPPRVEPDMTVDALVRGRILTGHARCFLVVAAGELAGVMTLTDVQRVPVDQWTTTTVYRAMTPASQLHTVGPQDNLTDVLRLMAMHDINQLPVLDGRELVGMLDRGDLLRFIEVRRDLGSATATPSAAGTRSADARS